MRKLVLIGFWGVILCSALGYGTLYMIMRQVSKEHISMAAVESVLEVQQDLSTNVTALSLKRNKRLEKEWLQGIDAVLLFTHSLDTVVAGNKIEQHHIAKLLEGCSTTMDALFSIQKKEGDDFELEEKKFHDLKNHLAIQVREMGRHFNMLHHNSQDRIDSLQNQISVLVFYAILFLVVYATVSIWGLHRYFLKPVANLLIGMQEYTVGNFSKRLPIMPSKELQSISQAIDRMIDYIDDSMVKKEILEKSEKRFRDFFSHSATAQLICTKEGEIIVSNRAFSRLLNRNATEEIRLSDFLSDEDKEAVLHEVDKVSSEPLGSFENIYVEVIGTKKIPSLVSGVLLEPGTLILSLENIAALVTYQKELERSNRELEQFAYVASHDLREPLRMVTSFTQLLQKRYRAQLGDEGNEFIEFAVDGARRMNTLVDDLLRLSRINTAKGKKEAVSLKEVIALTKRDLQILMEEHSCTLRLHMKNDVSVWSDFSQVKQVFQNFLSNAIKFTPEGRTPVIDITVTTRGGKAHIAITDNGIGIAEEHFERIFQVFKRLHTRSEYEGNGIGLSVCKKIIEKNNGSIHVDSKPGEGTTFTFTLELYEEEVCTAN